jgi:O-antigen/teichoic acid export membrane protein
LLLVSIAAMLAAMITPHLSHDWEAGRREEVARRLRLFLKLFGLGLFAADVAVLTAAPLLFDVALHGKFPAGQAALPWTLVYSTWFGLALVAQNYLLCAEKARLWGAALACGLALNVPLNLALLPRLGLEGAVLGTTAANALSLGLVCFFNRRLGFHLDDGAKLVLVLPMLLCLGPLAAVCGLLVVAAEAVCGRRLFSAEEKQRLAERLTHCAKQFGLKRWPRAAGG